MILMMVSVLSSIVKTHCRDLRNVNEFDQHIIPVMLSKLIEGYILEPLS